MIFLEISTAIIFLGHKILLVLGKKSGWVMGIIGAIISLYYFYAIGLYLYMILQMGGIVQMAYGLLTQKNPKIDGWINVSMIGMMILFLFFVTIGQMTIVEFVS